MESEGVELCLSAPLHSESVWKTSQQWYLSAEPVTVCQRTSPIVHIARRTFSNVMAPVRMQ